MRFQLVVFDRSEDGKEEGLFAPYKDDYNLYGSITKDTTQFIWVHISGDVKIPQGIALRPGWRLATAEDANAKKITYMPWTVDYFPIR